MAQLAIRGHATRGREVIELLEMLDGKNHCKYWGNDINKYYYIDNKYRVIEWCHECTPDSDFVSYTLEEFLKNFPYKVGDKVLINDDTNDVHTITSMVWDINRVAYRIQAIDGIEDTNYWFAYEMMPYEEEIMKETDPISPTSEINLNHPCFDAYNEIKLIIPTNWKFEQRGKEMFGVRKQYPKTYEECLEVLDLIDFDVCVTYVTKDERELFTNFIKLKRCRDAYWKIAGEQMRLGKPWEPNDCQIVYSIGRDSNRISLCNDMFGGYFILEFPTAEIRDAFFENFKELIELCKELL